MSVWLIYNKEDCEINKFAINKYISSFEKRGIGCLLVLSHEYLDKDYLPTAVINRTNNFVISEYFETKGIPCFNNSTVTKICNDKSKTYSHFAKDIPYLPVYEIDENSNLTFPCIIKSRSGRGGKQVFLVNSLKEIYDYKKYIPDLLIQNFLPNAIDIRTYVINNMPVVSIERKPNVGFKANYKINHNAQLVNLNDEQIKIINKVIEKEHFDYVGIDILTDGENSYLSEIEDSVGARSVYDLTNIDIIDMYVEHIISSIK